MLKIIFYEVLVYDLSKVSNFLSQNENSTQHIWKPRDAESTFLYKGIMEVFFVIGG